MIRLMIISVPPSRRDTKNSLDTPAQRLSREFSRRGGIGRQSKFVRQNVLLFFKSSCNRNHFAL